MSKVKLNSGLGAIILLASIFSGWSTLLIVSVLMLLFCEIDEKVKSIMTRVISFFVVITLISMGWSIITGAFDLLVSTIENFVTIINSYSYNPATLFKFTRYFVTPINTLLDMVGNVISFGITISKFLFIIFVLVDKKAKDNFITKKVNMLISKVVNFVNATNEK